MALVVTPGAQDADSYVSVAEAAEYVAKKGLTFPTSPAEPAEQSLRRATAWLDATYRSRFPGAATDVWQALEWPRSGVIYRGQTFDEDTIPQQVKDACCEAAVREMEEPGSLAPDIAQGGLEKRLKAGSVEVERFDNAGSKTEPVFKTIDGLLGPFLRPSSNVTFLKRA